MSSKYSYITHLFTKLKHGSEMTEVAKLSFKVGYGIEGDINANPISPRQVLIVRHEDILELSIPPGKLRENIVIKNVNQEQFLPGSIICCDNGAVIRLTFYCEPCKRISHLVDSLKVIERKRGILGVVITGGEIEVGNNFQIENNKFPTLSENSYERFLYFVAKIPKGKVVTYKQIIYGIGVGNSYMRAIPTYLKKTSAADYPIHRILDSEGKLIQHVHNQKEKLESEGIDVLYKADLLNNSNNYCVALSKYIWEDQNIYLI
ncbi:MAG: MGMT family protein [Scytonematopsis contorta HA4267-MV1]|jgi:alkylated DNA nucleotide flippase Atl1|nr:MGMT family protein [Scytonematopsis contorta HA4267-MV1]